MGNKRISKLVVSPPGLRSPVERDPIEIPDHLRAAYGSLVLQGTAASNMAVAVDRAKLEMERLANLRLPPLDDEDEAE